MRTLNKSWLENNPAGDEKSIITLDAHRKDNFGHPLNPDGSRPRISIKSSADTHLKNLTMLSTLTEDEGQQILVDALIEAFLNVAVANGADPETLNVEEVLQTSGEFVTTEFTLSYLGDDDERESVDFEITAPCAMYAAQAFEKTVTSRALQQAAIALCPEVEDDEDGDPNEVLIIN